MVILIKCILFGIHRFLFEDIYPFAGLLRSENIAKDSFRFAEWRYIEEQLDNILNKLKNEDYLKGLDKNELAEKLAYYMAEINVLHPLNIKNISSKDMLEASIESVVDTTFLQNLIEKCLTKK